MNDHVETVLAGLPDPVPPAALARTVMARVARLAEESPGNAVTSSVSGKFSRVPGRGSWNDVAAWAAAIGGLAIVFVSWVDGGLEPGSWLDLAWWQIGTPSPVAMATDGTVMAAFALGLLLYMAALFAPLRDGQQQ